MVVDDNQGVLELIKNIFSPMGYQVITANNGAAALKKLTAIPKPDLILTDYCMPLINGSELIERLAGDNRFSDIPILVITGSLIDLIKLPSTPNYSGCIKKPFEITNILSIVNTIIHQKSSIDSAV